MKRSPIETYLRTRAITAPWQIAGCAEGGLAGAVVIPALAEGERLFATLASLAANPPEILARFLVLVVVNHREDAAPADKGDNCQTLAQLVAASDFPAMNLAWIDAASPGLEMPAKGGGVGLARKIGLDLALARLDHETSPALLVCLDADTLVESSYLPAIISHFRETEAGGAAIPFRHQRGRTLEEQRAIDRYELFLRHYLLGLRIAGSPYAFHTVGSAMACTATAYARTGGMNTRAAGEDFYFLQHLSRTVGVARMKGTVVYPSPRPSHRVPFGTGRSVSRWLAGDGGAITFYRPDCFRIIGSWLELVEKGLATPAWEVMAGARNVSPHLAEYLETSGFPEIWGGLQRNHPVPERLLAAFHCWFDGLRTMKLIHHLSVREHSRCGPEEALPGLLRLAGAEPLEGISAQLALLRMMEEGEWG